MAYPVDVLGPAAHPNLERCLRAWKKRPLYRNLSDLLLSGYGATERAGEGSAPGLFPPEFDRLPGVPEVI